jgi:hypothetical protein
VYCSALQRLPALVRQWWSELEPRVVTLVEQVTSVHCAPLLCAQEIKVIQSKDVHHGNMLVINTTADTNQGCYKCLSVNKLVYFYTVKDTNLKQLENSMGSQGVHVEMFDLISYYITFN